MKKMLSCVLLSAFINLTYGQSWNQIGNDIDGEASSDKSGTSTSLSADGTIIAIGAIENDGNGSNSGQVRIFKDSAGVWSQIGNDIDGESSGDQSGYAVSLNSNGSIVAIGAPFNDGDGGFDNGHVRVYQNLAGVWTQIGDDIDGENGLDQFGNAVSISADGSIVAIGGFFNDDNGGNAGHVRVYQNISGTWTQIGQDIDGEASGDEFGSSLSLSSNGKTLAIGAPYNDGNGGFNSGHVRVYENLAGVWTQIGDDIDGEASNDQFGTSVSLSSTGFRLAIGAIGNDGKALDAGHVKVYENISGTWTQIGDDIDGENEEDKSGYQVSLNCDGSIIAIGAIYNYDAGLEKGHVRVFKLSNNSWNQLGDDIDGENMYDQSGKAIAISSDGLKLAIGAHKNDGNGNNSGHARVYYTSTQYVDTTVVTINDTVVFSDTIVNDIYDTTIVFDTTFVTVNDTTIINIYDTTLVTINDTVVFSDTLVNDIYDTTMVFDTSLITINDTVTFNIYDTTKIFDTTLVTVNDTVVFSDTLVHDVYDTTYLSVEDTLVIMMNFTSSLNLDNNPNNVITAYPNPAKDLLNIKLEVSGDYQITLYNSNGQVLSSHANVLDTIQINISDLSAGLYYINVQDNDNIYNQERIKIFIQ